MKLDVNKVAPTVMHIDLNSCFAIIEQQANRLLRGRPVGVAAYDTPRGFVVASSYEAKARGVKLGVNVGEARALCPDIVIMTPDPSKYREAHKRFKKVLLDYTDDVTPKSIDEFVVHLENSPIYKQGVSPEAIGYEIKEKIYESLGEAVTVNVGIGPNRFLAKLAAGLHKPNGLDTITHENLRAVYKELDLLDLPGINTRYKRRLEAFGIKTPLQFLDADEEFLRKGVFKSIVGQQWYMRLRGHEPDRRTFDRKTIGHQHALSKHTADPEELHKVLMKLCEKAGRRLRKNNLYAGGIVLWVGFAQQTPSVWRISGEDLRSDARRAESTPALRYSSSSQNSSKHEGFSNTKEQYGTSSRSNWHHSEKVHARLYATHDIYTHAKRLLVSAEVVEPVRSMAVAVFDLHEWDPEQLDLFGGERGYLAARRISDALDAVNNRYGEFVVTPATMLSMKGVVLDRIAFGGIRDMDN